MVSSRPFPHFKTSPVFEVSSISIVSNIFHGDDRPSSIVHGVMMLIDDEDRAITFFSRSQRKALKEPLLVQDGISVVLPKCRHDSPYWLPEFFRLKFLLIDEVEQNYMAEEGSLLDFSNNIDYDTEQELKFHKGGKLITLRYTVFQCAVIACVEFTVLKNDEGLEGVGSDDPRKVCVYGTVYATCKLRNGKDVSRLLFDNRVEASRWVADVPFDLAAVAVPFYSSLGIHAELTVDGEQFVTGGDAWEFKPDEYSRLPYVKTLVGKKWCLQVEVSWRHALDFARLNESFDLVNRKIKDEDWLWRRDIFSNLPMNEQLRIQSLPLPCSYSEGLVEVYSVSIHSRHNASDAFSLYGSIVCYDNDYLKGYTIFTRDKNDPYVVHPNGTLPLVHPGIYFEGPCFQVHIDLKDVDGREISNGFVRGWDMVTASGWYDSRLCSVVRGIFGFASIHYSIFSFSIPLTIKVILRSYSVGQILGVYGSIKAAYNSYRYCNAYEKRYFPSMLFDKKVTEFVELHGGDVNSRSKSAKCRNAHKPVNVKQLFEESDLELSDRDSEFGGVDFDIPLSKSIVVVPKGALLVLEVRLCLQVAGRHLETLEGKVTFTSIKAAAPERIEGVNNQLFLSVKW